MIHIIKHKRIFLSISVVFVVASIIIISLFGLRPGIDFTGGTLWHLQFSDPAVSEQSVLGYLKQRGLEAIVYREVSTQSILIKTQHLSEDTRQDLFNGFSQQFGEFEELRFEAIGPAIGDQLKRKAIWAIILVLFAISIYIAISFRKVSFPVSSWKYGVATLGALVHDVLVPTGVLALLGYLKGVEMDSNFIVALLVIMGFSVHDTIVVFDRIRENLLARKNQPFEEVVNDSVNQTLARSINTSLTLVLMLVAMLVVGSPSLRYFTLILLIGTLIGTYSSIFIASSLLTIWYNFGRNKNIKK